MFENILVTSIFVQILAFACISIVAINLIVGLISLGLTIYIKLNRL